MLCAAGPARSPMGLSHVPEHRRRYGALYDGLNQGRVNEKMLWAALLAAPLPRDGTGRIVLAVDVSNWLRPDAAASPERLLCYVSGRGTSTGQIIPGWPYSFSAAVEPGRTSWTRNLDVRRLGFDDSDTAIAAGELSRVLQGIIAAGHWCEGDPKILVHLRCRLRHSPSCLAAFSVSGGSHRQAQIKPRVLLTSRSHGAPPGRVAGLFMARNSNSRSQRAGVLLPPPVAPTSRRATVPWNTAAGAGSTNTCFDGATGKIMLVSCPSSRAP